jgi:hypothetical protein
MLQNSPGVALGYGLENGWLQAAGQAVLDQVQEDPDLFLEADVSGGCPMGGTDPPNLLMGIGDSLVTGPGTFVSQAFQGLPYPVFGAEGILLRGVGDQGFPEV